MDDRWWQDPLRELVAGRRVILAGGVGAGWTPLVRHLREAGAGGVLVYATEGFGVGEAPDAEVVAVAPPDDVVGMMARLRAGLDLLADPPPAAREALDRFDPDRTAVVFGSFLNTAPSLAGRPLVAHRRPEWVALEDKTVVDDLLDRAGVARAPSIVVPLADAAGARRSLDAGAGTVWAADAREGFHGGATATRWVVDDHEAAAVTAELGAIADTVRVMPFLDGVATSIHGIVLPDGVVTLRPVELVTLRRGRQLVYAGCATFWDPPDRVREEMREAARRVGAQLAAEVGFRGAFTLDGVVTVDGFRPTEVNPRYGAGLNVVARQLADVPLLLVLDLVVAGRPLAVGAVALERWLVDVADAHRGGGTWRTGAAGGWTGEARAVRYDGIGWSCADDGKPGDAVVRAGPGFAQCLFDPARTPVGPSVGPRAAAFWNWFEDAGARGLSPLSSAPDRTAR